MARTAGTGTVMPPGTITGPHRLEPGKATVTIQSVDPENGYDDEGKPVPSDHMEALCVYPCGFTRSHQVKTVEDLLPKVVNQMRGKYGVAEIVITKAPKALKAGEAIEMEVKNGK